MTTSKSAASPPLLADRVRSAVIWRSGSQIAAQLVMWTATLLVVRLLDPQDYGLFAMSQVVLVMLNFLNGYSFATSLIRGASPEPARIAQVFGLLIVLNLGLAIAQFAAAPLAAAYFHQPILATMLRVQALLYLPTPFIALPSALLARSLDFRKQGLVNLASALAAAVVALAGALSGSGVWTLVAAPIALFSARAIGLTLVARLLVWPSFDFRGAGEMLRFGGALMLAQLFWIVQSQADVVIAGRSLSPHDLGLYAEALFVTQILTAKFIPPLNEVAFPAYAELAKNGGDVGPAFLKAIRIMMLLTAPVYVGLAVTADPLVITLFGPKWQGMARLVAVIALAMPFFTLQIICSPATNALGRPGIYARTGAAGATIMPLAFATGIGGGVLGLALSWLVAAPLLLAVTLALTLPAIGVSFAKVGRSVLPAALASAAMGGIVYAVLIATARVSPPVQLSLLIAVGATCYALLLHIVSPESLAELHSVVRRRQPLFQAP